MWFKWDHTHMKAFKTPTSQHDATEICGAAARASSLLPRWAVPDGPGAPSSLLLTCSRTFGLFPYVVIMNTATKHIHAQVFLCRRVFISLGRKPRSGTDRLESRCTFNFVRNKLPSRLTAKVLHSHQQWGFQSLCILTSIWYCQVFLLLKPFSETCSSSRSL